MLEGSVRKSGNTVRITAQLIRAADGTHLWSETYDRTLDDIFAVQDEIAGAIVQAFQIKLKGGELSRSPAALKIWKHLNCICGQATLLTITDSSINRAGEYLEEAVKLDPSYGAAWLRLAENLSLKADNGMLRAECRLSAGTATGTTCDAAEPRSRCRGALVAPIFLSGVGMGLGGSRDRG